MKWYNSLKDTSDQNRHKKYIIRIALEEAQAGVKIVSRSTKNLRYADDATFMAESEEELKSLLMKVKEAISFSFTFCH